MVPFRRLPRRGPITIRAERMEIPTVLAHVESIVLRLSGRARVLFCDAEEGGRRAVLAWATAAGVRAWEEGGRVVLYLMPREFDGPLIARPERLPPVERFYGPPKAEGLVPRSQSLGLLQPAVG